MSLEQAIEICGITELEAMNRLQNAGVVSDLCVTAQDVAAADVERAAEFLLTFEAE